MLLICYFARKKNHRVRAVFDLILAILCAAGGVVLLCKIYIGIYRARKEKEEKQNA